MIVCCFDQVDHDQRDQRGKLNEYPTLLLGEPASQRRRSVSEDLKARRM
jgi:hypothetical protein